MKANILKQLGFEEKKSGEDVWYCKVIFNSNGQAGGFCQYHPKETEYFKAGMAYLSFDRGRTEVGCNTWLEVIETLTMFESDALNKKFTIFKK